jgi:hypothetical protein
MSYFECTRCKASLAWNCDDETGVYEIVPCDCGVQLSARHEIITCWYQTDAAANWKTGFFHGWSNDHDDLGHYPVAIIEDASNSRVHVVYAPRVSFSPNAPLLE